MDKADFVKLNDDELEIVVQLLGLESDSFEGSIQYLSEYTSTPIICVTRGAKGAVLYVKGEYFYHDGYQVEVADTVGAGDSFLAGLISQILNNKPFKEAINFACALGAIVASRNGANPEIGMDEICSFMDEN